MSEYDAIFDLELHQAISDSDKSNALNDSWPSIPDYIQRDILLAYLRRNSHTKPLPRP